MNTEETLTSLRHRITSMNSVPLDKVTVPVAELAVALQEIERLQAALPTAVTREPALVQVRLKPNKAWLTPSPTKTEPTSLARAQYLVDRWPDRYEMRLLYLA